MDLAISQSSLGTRAFFTHHVHHRRGHRHRFHEKSNHIIASKPSSQQQQQALPFAQSMACGAIARAAQIFTVFPIDTVKTRLQSTRIVTKMASTPSTTNSVTKAITQGKLYTGVGVTLAGQVPYGMLTFGIYETVRSKLIERYPDLPNWLNITVAATIGDAVGSLWLTPAEVIKSKTQTGLYNSTLSAMKAISTNSKTGPFAFYQGYPAAIARDIPFRVIQMILFEQTKMFYTTYRQQSKSNDNEMNIKLSGLETLVLGAVSGSITACLTNPFDVIRTRVMSQPVGDGALYKNAMDCIVKTVSKEGMVAFFKGVGPRAFMVGPSTAIFFLTYEGCKSFFRSKSKAASLRVGNNDPSSCCSRQGPMRLSGRNIGVGVRNC